MGPVNSVLLAPTDKELLSGYTVGSLVPCADGRDQYELRHFTILAARCIRNESDLCIPGE